MQTDTCHKCTAEIATDADRCPQCGFEPSLSAGLLVIWYLALLTCGFCLLLAGIAVLLVADGLPLGSAAIVAGVCLSIATVAGSIVWLGQQQSSRGPTDPPAFG